MIESENELENDFILLIEEIKNKSYSNIYWSNLGQYCVLATYGPKQ
jgi:hypothetical protein